LTTFDVPSFQGALDAESHTESSIDDRKIAISGAARSERYRFDEGQRQGDVQLGRRLPDHQADEREAGIGYHRVRRSVVIKLYSSSVPREVVEEEVV
jgi:hypothetical protein